MLVIYVRHIGRLGGMENADPPERPGTEWNELRTHLIIGLQEGSEFLPPRVTTWATVTWQRKDDAPRIIAMWFWDAEDRSNSPYPVLVSHSPATVSRNGEYHTMMLGLVEMDDPESFMDAECRVRPALCDWLARAESALIREIESGRARLDVFFGAGVPPGGRAMFEERRIALQSLVMTAMYAIGMHDVEWRQYVVDTVGELAPAGHTAIDAVVGRAGMTGFKLVPITVRELETPRDLRLGAWGEILALQVMTDCLINGLLRNTPAYCGTSYLVAATNAQVFDGEGVRRRIALSGAAEDAVREQRRARAQLLALGDSRALSECDAISHSISLAYERLVLSDIVARHMVTQMGGSLAFYMADHTFDEGLLGIVDYLENGLFELWYALYVAHSVAGIVHRDVHPGNVVVREYYTGVAPQPDDAIAYIIRGQQYNIKPRRVLFSLIDFGSVLVSPEGAFAARMNAGHTATYVEEFITGQADAFVAYIERAAPEVVARHRGTLRGAAAIAPRLAFAAAAAIDFVMAARTVGALATFIQSIEQKHEDTAALLHRAQERIEAAERVAKRHFAELLDRLLEHAGGARTRQAPLPDVALIGEVFADFRHRRRRADAISYDGIYDADTPLTYTLYATEKRIPSWLQKYEVGVVDTSIPPVIAEMGRLSALAHAAE